MCQPGDIGVQRYIKDIATMLLWCFTVYFDPCGGDEFIGFPGETLGVELVYGFALKS
jgi:hypothetical protein